MLTVSVPPHAHGAMLAREPAVRVFARFRTEQSSSLHAGNVVSSHVILSSLQSNEHTTAEWVSSRLVSHSSTTWLFEVNPEMRWLYAWDSGATKAQRQTRHLLEAVVVTSLQHQPHNFHVLTTTQSPTFTFVSFRRAADNESTQPDQSLLFRALTWEMQYRDLHHHGSPHQAAVHPLKRPLSPSSIQQSLALVPTKKPSGTRPVVHSQDLTTEFASLFAWLGTRPARQLDVSFIAAVEDDIRSKSLGSRANVTHFRAPADAVGIAARLVWWLQTDESLRRETHAHVLRAVGSLGNPIVLQQAHERWLNSVARRCESFLLDQGWTWRELHDSATSIVAAGAAGLGRHPLDFESFVATVRQSAVRRKRELTSHRRSADLGIWICSVSDVLVHHARGEMHALNLLHLDAMMDFWMHLSAIHLEISTGTTSVLTVSSAMDAPSRLRSAQTGIQLVLDRRHRCFATLPHGEPSLSAAALSGHSIGEYIGSITHGSVGSSIVHATFYAWPREERTREAYRYHCVLTFPHETESSELQLRIGVDRTFVDRRATCSMGPLETLSLPAKLALVDEWVGVCKLHVPYRRLQ